MSSEYKFHTSDKKQSFCLIVASAEVSNEAWKGSTTLGSTK